MQRMVFCYKPQKEWVVYLLPCKTSQLLCQDIRLNSQMVVSEVQGKQIITSNWSICSVPKGENIEGWLSCLNEVFIRKLDAMASLKSKHCSVRFYTDLFCSAFCILLQFCLSWINFIPQEEGIKRKLPILPAGIVGILVGRRGIKVEALWSLCLAVKDIICHWCPITSWMRREMIMLCSCLSCEHLEWSCTGL